MRCWVTPSLLGARVDMKGWGMAWQNHQLALLV